MAARTQGQKTVQVRVEEGTYDILEAVARQERRSVSQTARALLEEALRLRSGGSREPDDLPSDEIARLVASGGGFDWLADEPDLYNDTSGEPL